MPKAVPLDNGLSTLPYDIGIWSGVDSNWVDGQEYFMGIKNEIKREYEDPGGQKIYLYAGYFANQRQNKRLVSLYDKLLHAQKTRIRFDHGVMPTAVNHNRVDIGGSSYEVVFWYWFPGGEITDRMDAKKQTIIDGLLHRHNNAAVIMLAKKNHFPQKPNQISASLLDFLEPLYPRLLSLFGQKKQV